MHLALRLLLSIIAPLRPYRHRVLGLLFLLSIITYIDRVCISVAGPQMQRELDISPVKWGWVVGVFAISYAAFEIPSGALGDRIGARKVLTRIVLWWSAFTSLTGAVSNYFLLLVVRFMFGAGEAGAYPNSSSSISRWFPVAERARAHGLVWMASRVGGALSPLLVIPIQTRWGWRASFYCFGVLGVIWAAIWFWWYRDTPREKRGVPEREIQEIEQRQGAAGRLHQSLPWGKAVQQGNFWAILLMYHTYCWGSYFFLSWLHTFLAHGRGFTPAEIRAWSPLPFIFGGVANLAGGLTSDYLVRRVGLKWGRRLVGVTGLTASALFMLATSLTQDKLASVLLLACAYAGSDFMLPVAWAVCLDVGRKYAGAMTGAMNMSGQVGSFLSSVVFGYLVGWFGTYDALLYPMAGMLLLSAGLWLKIDATRELAPEAGGAGRAAHV
jgi:MFS family permease